MTINTFVAYTFSYIVNITLLVYILDMPLLISGNERLVREYYEVNFIQSFILDFFLIAIYLFVAESLIKRYNIKHLIWKLLTVLLVTIIISGGFYLYFINRPMTSLFFSRWFHKVEWRAVAYDCVLICCNYIIYTISLRGERMTIYN
jgi:hypothetical protein